MELLHGKAETQFENWLRDNYSTYYYSAWGKLPESAQMGVIIEWLDSVGIYIDAQPYIEIDETKRPPNIFFFPNVIDITNLDNSIVIDDHYPTRQEATTQAIIKAVEIVNSLD